jgi:hypothetical protein
VLRALESSVRFARETQVVGRVFATRTKIFGTLRKVKVLALEYNARKTKINMTYNGTIIIQQTIPAGSENEIDHDASQPLPTRVCCQYQSRSYRVAVRNVQIKQDNELQYTIDRKSKKYTSVLDSQQNFRRWAGEYRTKWGGRNRTAGGDDAVTRSNP